MVTSAEAFPGKYLKTADLQGRTVRVIMGGVQKEEVGRDKEEKYVLYFHGKERGLILNVTNWNNIADLYGDESDNWEGKPIELHPDKTDMAGKRVDCIRVRAPETHGEISRKMQAPPAATPRPADALDDEIPF